MNKTEYLKVRVTPELKQALKVEAQEFDMELSDFVRMVLKEVIKGD